MDPNSTDALFAIIRKELNNIVEIGEKKSNTSKVCIDKEINSQTQIPPNLKQDIKSPPSATSDISKGIEETHENIHRMRAGEAENSLETNAKTTKDNKPKLIAMGEKFKPTLEKDIAHQTAIINSPRTKSIDADIQRMQMELQNSYNLFQGISEKFEAINFSNLQKRIKELNLSNMRDVVGTGRADELKSVVDEGFKTNRMNEMTVKVGEKFSKHPGEFGNIPELSSFFQACTQLEHVLVNLKRQRNDVHELEERMRRSTEISYNRINHIKKELMEKKRQDPSSMQNDIDN